MPTQRETLSLYAALTAFEPDWPGRLLLSTGLNEAGRTVALAALAAGAATLILEEDPLLLKQASRDVTFTVTTLDEALRALKNEIRQRRAITVALAGNPEKWLKQMEERGVQPDAIVAMEQFVSLTNLLQRGARNFQATSTSVIAEDQAENMTERRARDRELIEAHPEQRRWLAAAPTLFPRALTRTYLLDQ